MKQPCEDAGFTLIELLAVIIIIVILAGLVFAIYGYVTDKAARERSRAEIQAYSGLLEKYKLDNGAYPDDGTTSGTYVSGTCANLNAKTMGSPLKTYANNTTYPAASLVLYRALSGDRNCDGVVTDADRNFDLNGTALATPLTALPAVYTTFKPGQLKTENGGMASATNKVTAIADPYGNSYGYSTAYAGYVLQSGTATPAPGYNPTYDLWSTAGRQADPPASGADTVTPTWITNW